MRELGSKRPTPFIGASDFRGDRSHPRFLVLVATIGIFLSVAVSTLAAEIQPDIVLRGTVRGQDNHTYHLIPFTVPPGTARITVDFAYSGKEQRTALDLGVFDPNGFRGWSGGNKSFFTISASDATPSYMVGAIIPGTWNLLIAVPNIRSESVSEFTAKIYFAKSGLVAAEPEVLAPTLSSAAKWYRGDLHSHTAHSDGGCASQAGAKVPCPLFLTAQAAAHRGLDFLAITDHNTNSQFAEMRELQPYFDKLLLIPGRELTSFQGHANLFGTTDFVDFRVTSNLVPSWNDLIRALPRQGVVLSINHPARPTGEDCMGCGWVPDPPIDWKLIRSLEAVNDGDADSPNAGIAFWQARLNEGFRITGIGGGDNHNAPYPPPGVGSIGYPTTVVWAHSLSTSAILDGILRGHVFIDVMGSTDRVLEFSVDSQDQRATMGDSLQVSEGAPVAFEVHAKSAAGGVVEVLQDGVPVALIADNRINQPDRTFSFQWKCKSGRHWFRINVRGEDGKLWLVGNPIYFNFE